MIPQLFTQLELHGNINERCETYCNTNLQTERCWKNQQMKHKQNAAVYWKRFYMSLEEGHLAIEVGVEV